MNKSFFVYSILVILLFFSCNKDETTNGFEEISISLGGNLVYDIYYSFNQGEIAKVKRSDWDIAFSVPLQTAAIRINEGSGAELFSAGSANDWNNLKIPTGTNVVDKLWNDKSDWLIGAFNRYTDPSNVFNYSWGTYDHAVTYDVLGDSVYVIKLTDGSQKKIFIEKRDGHENKYYVTWANLDGSDSTTAIIDMNVSNKNFVYFSLKENKIVDFEPDADLWDLLFTVYKEKIPINPGSFIDYDVMGVLINQQKSVAKVDDKNPEDACLCDAENFTNEADIIGWDWKEFDNQNKDYVLDKQLSYFVKVNDNETYQIHFTNYNGTQTGNISFKVKKEQ
jgi:hypothetical protein